MQSPCLSVAMQTLCCGVVDFDRPKTVRFLDVAPMELWCLRDKRTPEDILRMSAGVQNCRTGVNISGTRWSADGTLRVDHATEVLMKQMTPTA